MPRDGEVLPPTAAAPSRGFKTPAGRTTLPASPAGSRVVPEERGMDAAAAQLPCPGEHGNR